MAQKSMKEFFARYLRYFIIIGLFLLLVAGLVVFLIRNKGRSAEEKENTSTIPELETTVEVPTDKYEENAYPAVNSLIEAYLGAMSKGDTETMASLSSSLSDDAKAFYEAQAQYVGSYSDINVYTKKGPKDNSYFLLTTYNLLINGQSEPLPALLSMYVCTNDTGSLYVNSENLTSEEEAYILELVAQKDFADLIEQVELDYNAKLESNEALAGAANSLKDDINGKAQELLEAKAQEEMEAAAQAEAQAQQEAQEAASTQVKCIGDNVNIRKSASADSDAIGKTALGDVYTRYEALDNGWSKIDYNGTDAYIKSEYLEEIAPAPEENAEGTENAEGGENAEGTENADASSETKTGGNITIKENVNVRSASSETADKIATAYRGEQYELIEKANGWCKIKYKGQEAYVKADYVE